MSERTKQVLRLRLFGVLFFATWVLLTLYPNPAYLARSVYRLFNPPVDASIAAAFDHYFAGLDEAHAIDAKVQSEFPYQYDWVTYNLPWYFPTVNEAFANMAGDCKTRLVVLASVLESRGIAYTVSVSPTHIWVEYEGKSTNRIENAEVALFSSAGGGMLTIPAHFELRRSFDSFWTAFWTYMPVDRKFSLGAGAIVTTILLVLAGLTPARLPKRSGDKQRAYLDTAASGVLLRRLQAPATPK